MSLLPCAELANKQIHLRCLLMGLDYLEPQDYFEEEDVFPVSNGNVRFHLTFGGNKQPQTGEILADGVDSTNRFDLLEPLHYATFMFHADHQLWKHRNFPAELGRFADVLVASSDEGAQSIVDYLLSNKQLPDSAIAMHVEACTNSSDPDVAAAARGFLDAKRRPSPSFTATRADYCERVDQWIRQACGVQPLTISLADGLLDEVITRTGAVALSERLGINYADLSGDEPYTWEISYRREERGPLSVEEARKEYFGVISDRIFAMTPQWQEYPVAIIVGDVEDHSVTLRVPRLEAYLECSGDFIKSALESVSNELLNTVDYTEPGEAWEPDEDPELDDHPSYSF